MRKIMYTAVLLFGAFCSKAQVPNFEVRDVLPFTDPPVTVTLNGGTIAAMCTSTAITTAYGLVRATPSLFNTSTASWVGSPVPPPDVFNKLTVYINYGTPSEESVVVNLCTIPLGISTLTFSGGFSCKTAFGGGIIEFFH